MNDENILTVPEQEASEVVAQEEQNSEQKATAAPQPESEKERNYRQLREKAEKLERERDQYAGLLHQLEQEALKYQQQYAQQNTSQKEESEEDFNLDDDALVEAKHLKRKDKIYQKELQKLKYEIDQQKRYSQELAVESQLKARYPDADLLLTHENISSLRQSHPEIAASLASTPDMLTKALATCKLIKELGINNSPDPDRQRINSNQSKPRPVNSISPQQGETPLHQANAFSQGTLTDEMKRQLYKEMKEKSKG